MNRLVFVDCEAPYGCKSPASGDMTEFGAVHYSTRLTFHGRDCSRETMQHFDAWIRERTPGRAIFVSDNPAYDWQWINFYFDKYGISNPLGHSARRIGDFYAGLKGHFFKESEWKRLRVTPHDHNPVNDALGNAEAFSKMMSWSGGLARIKRSTKS